jgi:hypothetical protein
VNVEGEFEREEGAGGVDAVVGVPGEAGEHVVDRGQLLRCPAARTISSTSGRWAYTAAWAWPDPVPSNGIFMMAGSCRDGPARPEVRSHRC